MLRRVLGSLVAAAVVLMSWKALSQSSTPEVRGAPRPSRDLLAPLLRMGIAPVPAGSPGRFVLRRGQSLALFGDTGLTLQLPSRGQRGRVLGWEVVGARGGTPLADRPREAKLHRLVGPSEAGEQSVPTYERLRYPGLLPGVELWFEERSEGLDHGFRAERGADLRRIELEYTGARAIRIAERGRALEVDLGEDVLREQGLRCAQEAVDGTQHEVGCRFTGVRPVGNDRWAYAIEVDVEDPARLAVVTSRVAWNSYIGGTSDEIEIRDIEQNDTGELFVIGTIDTPLPADQPLGARIIGEQGKLDVFVAKYARDGSIAWVTLLGGREVPGGTGGSVDSGRAIAIGAGGELYIAGTLTNGDFEWTDSMDNPKRDVSIGATDGFVARLSSNGSKIEWFLRIGGIGEDLIENMLLAPSGKLFVVGGTTSGDLPNRRPSSTQLPRGTDGFIARVSVVDPPALPKVDWSFIIQDPALNKEESLSAILILGDGTDQIYVAGPSNSHPTIPARTDIDTLLYSINPGDTPGIIKDAVLAGQGHDEVVAMRFAFSGSTQLQVFGNTSSTNLGSGSSGSAGMFMATFPTSLNAPPTVELLGLPSAKERLKALSEGGDGYIYIGGTTSAPGGLPVEGGFDKDFAGSEEGFVARVRFDGGPKLEWASYVGGSGRDAVSAVHADSNRPTRLIVGGSTDTMGLTYSGAGDRPISSSAPNSLLLLEVDVNEPTPLPDGGVDAGVDAGVDGGTGQEDGGIDGGISEPDGGTDLEDAGTGGGTNRPRSPLGLSCGSTTTDGGSVALALLMCVGLAMRGAQRNRAPPDA